MVNRKIIHVDMDCFYAAVEEKYNPNLKGKPVVVGGSPESRGVVCSANYEARKFGVRSAIPCSHAKRLCPQAIFVPLHFSLYRQESQKVREIFERFTNLIQPLSLDEAYLDVTDSLHFGGSATLIAQEIRRLIKAETQLTASAGVAPNKFLAKIASDWKKPNGLFVLRPQDVEAFMPPLKIEKIWGVGKVTAAKMHELGFHTCGDIQKFSIDELSRKFGSRRAGELYRLARGEDNRPVRDDFERKSLSVEETFHRDLKGWTEIRHELPAIYDDWKERTVRGGYAGKILGIDVKLKYFDFQAVTKQRTFRVRELSEKLSRDLNSVGSIAVLSASNESVSIPKDQNGLPLGFPKLEDFERLMKEAWEKRPEAVRLLGMGAKLETSEDLEEDSESASALVGDPNQLKFAI